MNKDLNLPIELLYYTLIMKWNSQKVNKQNKTKQNKFNFLLN